jgi:zinc transporter ZupT
MRRNSVEKVNLKSSFLEGHREEEQQQQEVLRGMFSKMDKFTRS